MILKLHNILLCIETKGLRNFLETIVNVRTLEMQTVNFQKIKCPESKIPDI